MNADQLRNRIKEIATVLRQLQTELPTYEDDILKTAITHTKYINLDNECIELMMKLDTLEGKLT
jgi:hypothetical protein